MQHATTQSRMHFEGARFGGHAGGGGYEDVSAGAGAGATGNYNLPSKKQDEAAMYGGSMGGGQQVRDGGGTNLTGIQLT